jgi:hypothetical protein
LYKLFPVLFGVPKKTFKRVSRITPNSPVIRDNPRAMRLDN